MGDETSSEAFNGEIVGRQPEFPLETFLAR